MSTIKKVYADDCEDCLPLLKQLDQTQTRVKDWRELFKTHWPRQEKQFGFALMNDERPVGFLGTVFSDRSINQTQERFCNITSLIVEGKYRSATLMLVNHYARLKSCTLTCFTPSREVSAILKKFGFKELSKKFICILPIPFISLFIRKQFKIYFNPEEIEPKLSRQDRQFFEHHKKFHVHHILIQSDDEYCYLIATRVKKKGLNFELIHYLSNPDLFAQTAGFLAWKICWRFKSVGILAYDSYLNNRSIFPSIKITLPRPTFYKSNSLKRDQIDSLYSEYFVLNLN